MLMFAEGTAHRPVDEKDRRTAAAWLGPMADAGFLHSGWVDLTGQQVWMVISAADVAEAEQRLSAIPLAQDGSVTFTFTRVEALRIT